MHLDRQPSKTISLISDDDEEIFGTNFQNLESYDEKRWSRGHLRSQFETLEIYNLFRKYTDKINFGYFSLFLIITFVLFLTHTIVLITENAQRTTSLSHILPDLVIYSTLTLLSVVGLLVLELTQHRHQKWDYLCIIAFLVVFLANFFIPVYHGLNKTNTSYTLKPAYTFLLIIASYIFLGISKNWLAAVLGVFVTMVDLVILVIITYRDSDLIVKRVFSDLIFLVCFNGLGLYFRYLNEIVQRKSFLDRRDCIMNTFQLRHEKEQEEQLMASIIPPSLISKVKANYLRSREVYLRSGQLGHENPFKQELLEVHEGVTILFADIVNYTAMTKKLDINALLETLNELFGRFDDTSDNLKVIRIKFLGDCYYCISGLPPAPPPNPAEACVDLGLKMIKIINDVREKNNLDIDMRIGIHTGKIISGIIGKVKYQFDIWSKDVDIANKMESEGVKGKVHITNTTKNLLQKTYYFEATDKGETVPQFKQNHLKTFLVSPMPVLTNDSSPNGSINEPDDSHFHVPPPRPSLFRKNGALPILSPLHNSELPDISEEPRESMLTIIESNNLEQEYEGRRTITSSEGNGRRSTIYHKKASLRYKVNEERRLTDTKGRRTAFMSTNFKRYRERATNVDKEMEDTINNMSFSKKDQYIKEKEISSLLIFSNKQNECNYVKLRDPMFKYYVLSQVVLIFCVYLIQNLTLNKAAWLRYEFIFAEAALFLVIIPGTWTYYVYLKYITNFRESNPETSIVRFLYQTARFITYNIWARLAIYTFVYILFLLNVFFEVGWCHYESTIDPSFTNSGHCMVPWHMTESCALGLIMTFLFLKIFIWVKLLYALVMTVFYSYCVMYVVHPIYETSETFNPFLSPQMAHILSIVFLTFTLHLIDRQTDYMNRLDFLWTTKLLEEKKKADEQQAVNTHMLINILPKHVAKIYLDINREMTDLYYENHNHAAIMFASIIFDDVYTEDENTFLLLMNEYITIIDTLINRKEFSKVEKIKIAKWTYMAACGLTIPGENENVVREIETHHTSSTLDILLNFASSMFRQFKEKNGYIYDIQLRIGICHGPIVAGVVGSKKPLYDIWGDAVNMASRMDSTGCPGKIQVLETTAQEIEKLGYECEPRGMRKVKGVEGEVMTYFVKHDENFHLVRRTNYLNEE